MRSSSGSSKPSLPFATCKAVIEVVGVAYNPTDYSPVVGSEVRG